MVLSDRMDRPALPVVRLRGWHALEHAIAHDVMTAALRCAEDDPDEVIDARICRLDARIRWCSVVMCSDPGRWSFPALN
jgi:hypothetical protein